MRVRRLLVIGGTGIIGEAAVHRALASGWEVDVIAKERNATFPQEVRQILLDRRIPYALEQGIASTLRDTVPWEAVFDVFSFGAEDAAASHRALRSTGAHVFVLSTTLVYDRSARAAHPITEDTPLAALGTMGGYVDEKLALEVYWRGVTDLPWTILRPYHVLGPHSLLGCIPYHNRDPLLLERIQRGEPLRLCEGGEIWLNVIHPSDLGEIVLRSAGNERTFGRAYNAVNPDPVLAREYFAMVGELVGREPVIAPVGMREFWEELPGWELTTLPHLYDMGALLRDIAFVPAIPARTCIQEAFATYAPPTPPASEIEVHRRMNLLPRPIPPVWIYEL